MTKKLKISVTLTNRVQLSEITVIIMNLFEKQLNAVVNFTEHPICLKILQRPFVFHNSELAFHVNVLTGISNGFNMSLGSPTVK